MSLEYESQFVNEVNFAMDKANRDEREPSGRGMGSSRVRHKIIFDLLIWIVSEK